jgi:putative two-component system response regulator
VIQKKIVQILSSLMEFRGDFEKKPLINDHIDRIECFLRMLVEEMLRHNLYTDQLRFWNMEIFFQASSLHDIGKIAVRESLLLKPDRLTPDEYEEIKNHAIYGENIISKIRLEFPESKLLTQAQIIAGTHHERWDGGGYPRRLAGESIPLEGRFMALVDVFETLISSRPYKKSFSPGEALRIIKAGKGSQFDPVLTDAFVSAFRRQRSRIFSGVD